MPFVQHGSELVRRSCRTHVLRLAAIRTDVHPKLNASEHRANRLQRFLAFVRDRTRNPLGNPLVPPTTVAAEVFNPLSTQHIPDIPLPLAFEHETILERLRADVLPQFQ